MTRATVDLQHPAQGPPRSDGEGRATGAFLVRIWYEAREIVGTAPAFRGYIKNLHTGEERFVRDPAKVSEQIVLQMQEEANAEGEGHEGTHHGH